MRHTEPLTVGKYHPFEFEQVFADNTRWHYSLARSEWICLGQTATEALLSNAIAWNRFIMKGNR